MAALRAAQGLSGKLVNVSSAHSEDTEAGDLQEQQTKIKHIYSVWTELQNTDTVAGQIHESCPWTYEGQPLPFTPEI